MARPAIHPGEILADELTELNMSAADTALRLGQWLGTGPELWINLQKAYELRVAEQEKGKEIKRTIRQRNHTQETGVARVSDFG